VHGWTEAFANKAARGELRRGLPVGFIWGEQDGEVLFHPDEAVTGRHPHGLRALRRVRFGARVWLWFRSEGLSLPLQQAPAGRLGPIRWVTPTYTAVHHILTNPVYAGAYTYGKTRYERYVDEHGTVRKRIRHLPIEQWSVLLPDHHPGFIDVAVVAGFSVGVSASIHRIGQNVVGPRCRSELPSGSGQSRPAGACCSGRDSPSERNHSHTRRAEPNSAKRSKTVRMGR